LLELWNGSHRGKAQNWTKCSWSWLIACQFQDFIWDMVTKKKDLLNSSNDTNRISCPWTACLFVTYPRAVLISAIICKTSWWITAVVQAISQVIYSQTVWAYCATITIAIAIAPNSTHIASAVSRTCATSAGIFESCASHFRKTSCRASTCATLSDTMRQPPSIFSSATYPKHWAKAYLSNVSWRTRWQLHVFHHDQLEEGSKRVNTRSFSTSYRSMKSTSPTSLGSTSVWTSYSSDFPDGISTDSKWTRKPTVRWLLTSHSCIWSWKDRPAVMMCDISMSKTVRARGRWITRPHASYMRVGRRKSSCGTPYEANMLSISCLCVVTSDFNVRKSVFPGRIRRRAARARSAAIWASSERQ
jgi:hypothetical protein